MQTIAYRGAVAARQWCAAISDTPLPHSLGGRPRHYYYTRMTPEIICDKRTNVVRAVERFCSERGIRYAVREIRKRPLSAGELQRFAAAVGGADHLIDREGAAYKKRGLDYMDYDPIEEIIATPALARLPIVRTDHGTTIAPNRAELERLFTPSG
ncbi:MAG: glutaredoxin [Spirochaetales bacterium]|nr:glutaredoxin [Spirochaetales bacterium]